MYVFSAAMRRLLGPLVGKTLYLVCFLCAVSALSQEKKTISTGVLVEANANTRHGYGLAGGLTADFGITDNIAAGAKLDFGSDFYDVSSFEALAFGRWYFLKSPFPFFAQAGAGLITLFEEDRSASSVLVDGSVGFRVPLKRFYTEQYVRFGWPTGFGFGLVAGYRFDLKKPQPAGKDTALPVEVFVPVEQIAEPVTVEEEPAAVEEKPAVAENPPSGLEKLSAVFFSSNLPHFDGPDMPPEIAENNIRTINAAAEFLVLNPDYTVLIVGYANPVKRTALEESQELIPLSRARAEFIRDELVKRGVDPPRITIQAAGGQGADYGNWEANRRALLYFANPNPEPASALPSEGR
ncbi:MAG: hypothetical protein LBI67_10460 [Treponema sp.]|jgi:outer membrane protein OmpA-like peptidoglycan-associated protein|nr:hypothetical protein [Treponema sp.]